MSADTVTALESASLVSIMAIGLLLGLIHVLTGPDHLSALIVLSAGSSWRSCQLGVRWGCGHSTGLIVVTVCFVALDQRLDVEAFGSYCDFIVGFLMIALGLWSLRHYLLLRHKLQLHYHEARESTPSQDSPLSMQPNKRSCCFSRIKADIKNARTQKVTAFAYGTIHGLAGTGGILGVLPAVFLNDWTKSSIYLSAFCVSSIFTMGCFAALYGEITGRMSRFSDSSLIRVGIFSSCVSLCVGIMWIILVSTGTMDEVFG